MRQSIIGMQGAAKDKERQTLTDNARNNLMKNLVYSDSLFARSNPDNSALLGYTLGKIGTALLFNKWADQGFPNPFKHQKKDNGQAGDASQAADAPQGVVRYGEVDPQGESGAAMPDSANAYDAYFGYNPDAFQGADGQATAAPPTVYGTPMSEQTINDAANNVAYAGNPQMQQILKNKDAWRYMTSLFK